MKRPLDETTDVLTVPGPGSPAGQDVAPGAGDDFRSGQFRTRFANEAVDLAEIFKLLIGTTPVRGPTRFTVELSAPDGPSTGGGVQSVQHIKLIAEDGGPTLVAGWADQKAETCELRTLDYLDAQHNQRFRRSSLQAPPRPSERLDRKHYGQLLVRLRAFFSERELMVSVVDVPEQQTVTRMAQQATRLHPSRSTGVGRAGMVMLGVAIGLFMAAIGYLVGTR
jgi:hypothetical protein